VHRPIYIVVGNFPHCWLQSDVDRIEHLCGGSHNFVYWKWRGWLAGDWPSTVRSQNSSGGVLAT